MTKIHSKKKLGLNKDTLRALRSRELAAVDGGRMKLTAISGCPTACIDDGC